MSEWYCRKCGKPTLDNADFCMSHCLKVLDEPDLPAIGAEEHKPEGLARYISYKDWHMKLHEKTMNELHPPVPVNEDKQRDAYLLAGQGVEHFQRGVSEWADRTFPGQTTESKLAHLADELKELMAAPADGEEMADCFILLCNIAQRAGVNLMEAAVRKMDKNRVRQWGAPVWDNKLIKGNRLKPEGCNPFERVSTEAGTASVIKEIQERTAFPGFMKDWTPEQMVEAVVSWCENQIPTVVTAWWLKMDDPLGDSVMIALDPQTVRGKCIQLVRDNWCEEKAEELRKVEFDSAEWQETWQAFKLLMVETRNHYYEYGTESLGSPERGKRLVDLLAKADSVTAVTELLNRHKLVFVRQEGLTRTTGMFCEFYSEDGVTSEIEQLKNAVTRWLNETEEGRKAWLDACGDFNMGDLASCATTDLLAPYGLHGLRTEMADSFAQSFDMHLNRDAEHHG